MKTADFDYFLPPDRIAAYPAATREAARLMVVERDGNGLIDSIFNEIDSFLPPHSLLILNETRVVPARIHGVKTTGGRVELLLLRRADTDPPSPGAAMTHHEDWDAIAGGLGRAAPGVRLTFAAGLTAEVLSKGEAGTLRVRLRAPDAEAVVALLDRIGEVPLPPYIEAARRRARETAPAVGDLGDGAPAEAAPAELDRSRYQTVYASTPGAVAAPTAGLHFTEGLLAELRAAGHEIRPLTLHVGLGTFRPVKVEDVSAHVMDPEWYTIPDATAHAVEEARRVGRPIVAVGTTVVRALESAARAVALDAGQGGGAVRAGTASSRLFLTPGEPFHVVTDLITNFHLPRSTLLMLVSAFAGRERMLAAYAQAVTRGYRFFSYGDAMLIRSSR
jgi:S-adenosylmethionine:tRNA ribosyltransferase-isomerase